MKKLLLTTAEWLYLKWTLERNMLRMDADAFRLKEGEPGSEARREAIGKELESIEKERRNIELVLEKIKAADSVQDGTCNSSGNKRCLCIISIAKSVCHACCKCYDILEGASKLHSKHIRTGIHTKYLIHKKILYYLSGLLCPCSCNNSRRKQLSDLLCM